MKILVLSDSHGAMKYMEQAVLRESPDAIIHLGDYLRDSRLLEEKFPRIPLYAVPGNCDLGEKAPTEQVITLEGVRIFLTHGHRYQVKYMYLWAIYAALESDAQILLFGHTHRPECLQEQGLWAMNPGAAKDGCYGLITVSEGAFQLELKNVN